MDAEPTQVLQNALSNDRNVREHAEESLNQFQEQDLPGFLLSLSGQLANYERPIDSRRLAGLILKNTLYAKDQQRNSELVERWLSLDNYVKSQVKTNLLNTLSSTVADAPSTVSQVIAKVAGIELPQNQWPELIGSLLSNIHQFPAHVKQATLETLGYLCEEVSPDVIGQDHVDRILNAARQCMKASEGNNDVRLAATRALNNAFRFVRARFDHGTKIAVCEATASPDVRIKLAAFECLVSISSTNYEKLARYSKDIFKITAKAVRQDEESVVLQAMKFWSSICKKEIDIKARVSGIPCSSFIKEALPKLVPMLLKTLLKPEEIISEAGRTCLGLVAQIVGDDFVTHVILFIRENITIPYQREAASYAFRFILEGPSDQLASIITQSNREEIIRFLLHCMNDGPNVAKKACGVLYFHARDYEFRESIRTYFREQDLPGFLLSLSGELANDERRIDSRRLAGLILKITLAETWLSLDNDVKSQVRTDLVNTLSSPVSDARSTVSQFITKIAGIELRQGRWPELVRSLLSNFGQSPAHGRQATLETLGCLCEEVSADVIDQDHVNRIVRAVLWGMDFYEENNDVRFAAIRALYNALGLAQACFNEIMTAFLGAADFPDVRIRQAAFECLVSISWTYYNKLDPYFWDILFITDEAVRQGVVPVARKAIEFWSSICHKEIEILKRHGVRFYFIQRAQNTLVDMLIETLVNQEWIISEAGRRCLVLVVRTLVQMRFVEENITQPDSRQAVTYALASVLEGPSPALLNSIITEDNWQQIRRVLLDCMQDAPNVAEKACGVIYFLARHSRYILCNPGPHVLREIMDALETVIHGEGAGESRLRTVARDALFELSRLAED